MKLKNYNQFITEGYVNELAKIVEDKLQKLITWLEENVEDRSVLAKMITTVNANKVNPYNDFETIITQLKDKFELGDDFDMATDKIQSGKTVTEGLWSNIHAKRERGEKPARKGTDAYKKAVSAGKRINESEENFNDYPESARNNARKAIKWKEKYGKQVKGGTAVGWTRANQLASGENLSLSTVKRMKAFFDRHQKNKTVNTEYKNEPWRDNGYIAWLIWGGDSARSWAERKVKQYEKAQLQKTIKEEISIVLNEADLSIKQKINRFTKEIKALGAPNFYINPIVKGSDKYLRKFYVNTTDGEKDWAAVRKWIMSHPEAHKSVGVGVDNYSYMDNQNRLSYRGYSNGGYHYLSIEIK